MSARPSLCPRPALAALAAVAWAAIPARASAQLSGDGFLFHRPVVSLTLRGGYDRPFGGGDVFGEFADRLTLDRGAFGAATGSAELAFGVARNVDVAFGVGVASARRGSEFRHFSFEDDSPIRQSTSLRRVPLSASAKVYLTPRGRSVGSLAWIPARFTPFVGAGGGLVYYRLAQEGAFVDEATLNIFPSNYASSGWVPSAHAFAGADLSLSPRFVASTEFRYTHARGAPRGEFSSFDRIDLSGVALTAGVGVRF